MPIKEYAGGAAATTITADITSGATTCSITTSTNWPTGATGNFWVKIYNPANLATVEKIRCASRAGNVITFSLRGGDGTSATSHSAGETIEHVWTAEDAREANDHIFDTTNDDHTQYLNTPRHDLTARHVPGVSVPVGGTAAAIALAATGGVAADLSRSDHAHAFPAWSTFTPTPTGITLGNGTLSGRYFVSGKLLVGMVINFTVGSTTTFPGPLFGFALPPGVTFTSNVYLPVVYVAAGATGPLLGVALGAGPPILIQDEAAGSAHNLGVYTGAFPQAFAAGDTMTIQAASIEIN